MRMPARLPAALALWCLLGWCLPSCQSSGPWIDHETPQDYRFVFQDGSWLKGPAELHGRLYIDTGEAFWIHLTAPSGEMASVSAHRWTDLLNLKRDRLAENSSNSFVIRRVVRFELFSPLRGLKVRNLGESN